MKRVHLFFPPRRHGAPATPAETALWAAANASIWGLAAHQAQRGNKGAWAPLNGLVMMWPAAPRVAARADVPALLDGWEEALNRTMCPNFWPDLGGGSWAIFVDVVDVSMSHN